jgi:hypothetical protein
MISVKAVGLEALCLSSGPRHQAACLAVDDDRLIR